MKLGPVRIIVFNQEGEEVTRQVYDLSKSKGTKHWNTLWRWALHQGYSLQVNPQQKETSLVHSNAKPSIDADLRRKFSRAGAILSEPHRR